MGSLGGLIVGIVLIVGVLFLLVRISKRTGKKHQMALERVGLDHGLRYDVEVGRVVELGADIFSWFQKGRRFDLENGLTGIVDDIPVSYFELHIPGDGKIGTDHSVFALRSNGLSLPYFVLRPKPNHPSEATSFEDFFEIDADSDGFIRTLGDAKRSAMIQVRLAATWKDARTRPSPYYIRGSGEWLVGEWVFLAPELETISFESCLGEALGYAKALSIG